jgi:uncharacterized protein (DUF433 family)
MQIERITLNPAVVGGKPCTRSLRVAGGTILGLLATGKSREKILLAYPYLEPKDLDALLAYAAWRLEAGRNIDSRMSMQSVVDSICPWSGSPNLPSMGGLWSVGPQSVIRAPSVLQVRSQYVLPDDIGPMLIAALLLAA